MNDQPKPTPLRNYSDRQLWAAIYAYRRIPDREPHPWTEEQRQAHRALQAESWRRIAALRGKARRKCWTRKGIQRAARHTVEMYAYFMGRDDEAAVGDSRFAQALEAVVKETVAEEARAQVGVAIIAAGLAGTESIES